MCISKLSWNVNTKCIVSDSKNFLFHLYVKFVLVTTWRIIELRNVFRSKLIFIHKNVILNSFIIHGIHMISPVHLIQIVNKAHWVQLINSMRFLNLGFYKKIDRVTTMNRGNKLACTTSRRILPNCSVIRQAHQNWKPLEMFCNLRLFHIILSQMVYAFNTILPFFQNCFILFTTLFLICL